MQKRKEDAALHKQKLKDAMASGLRIIVDLDFDDKMTEKEVMQRASCSADFCQLLITS